MIPPRIHLIFQMQKMQEAPHIMSLRRYSKFAREIWLNRISLYKGGGKVSSNTRLVRIPLASGQRVHLENLELSTRHGRISKAQHSPVPYQRGAIVLYSLNQTN